MFSLLSIKQIRRPGQLCTSLHSMVFILCATSPRTFAITAILLFTAVQLPRLWIVIWLRWKMKQWFIVLTMCKMGWKLFNFEVKIMQNVNIFCRVNDKIIARFKIRLINSCVFHMAKRAYSAPSIGMFVCGRVYTQSIFELLPFFNTQIRCKIINYSHDYFWRSGAGPLYRVDSPTADFFRSIQPDFWSQTSNG
jgi:hypothetical protein